MWKSAQMATKLIPGKIQAVKSNAMVSINQTTNTRMMERVILDKWP